MMDTLLTSLKGTTRADCRNRITTHALQTTHITYTPASYPPWIVLSAVIPDSYVGNIVFNTLIIYSRLHSRDASASGSTETRLLPSCAIEGIFAGSGIIVVFRVFSSQI
jgi:hypothetical protein